MLKVMQKEKHLKLIEGKIPNPIKQLHLITDRSAS